MLGRSINEEEINNLMNMNDENFKKYIVDKFIQQRLKRVEFINDEQNNELERRIFIQTLDMNWKISSSIFRSSKTSNWIKRIWSKRSSY